MELESIQNYILQVGTEYGVNPIIFAILYFGTIPFSLLAFWWLGKNIRQKKSFFLPVLLAFSCFIGTYIYLFWVGKNIPNWVYLLIFGMMVYSGRVLVLRIKRANENK